MMTQRWFFLIGIVLLQEGNGNIVASGVESEQQLVYQYVTSPAPESLFYITRSGM